MGVVDLLTLSWWKMHSFSKTPIYNQCGHELWCAIDNVGTGPGPISKCLIHLHRSTLIISAFFWPSVRLESSYPSSFSMVVTVFCRICSFSSSLRTTRFWASTWDCRVATWSANTSFSSLSNFWIWLAFILCVFNRTCILWYCFWEMSKLMQNPYSATFTYLNFIH